MLTHVLMDLDGTLTDPGEGITRCIQHALESLGRPAPDADSLAWCIGPPLKESFSTLLETGDEALLERAIGFYRDRFSSTGIYENKRYPGIARALRLIREHGFTLMLATSKPTVYARRILEHFHILEVFEAVHGSCLDGRLSHKDQLLAHIIRTRELDPARVIMVGDRSHDILAGKANGTLTAAVAYGYGTAREIEGARPDMVFNTPRELSDFFEAESMNKSSASRLRRRGAFRTMTSE